MDTPEEQIKHYLLTGYSDESLGFGWPGKNIFEKCISEKNAIRDALIDEVRRRANGLPQPKIPVLDSHAFTRSKVAPMVNGLFPEDERSIVLDMLEKSVVFLTAENIEDVLRRQSYSRSAWTLANLYLGSIGAEFLSETAESLVGLSEATTCYVSHEYFRDDDWYADFVVHEAAHVFHNCKRATIGLRETRAKEFLLSIDFRERETFAYACEVYSRILEHADNKHERLKLVAQAREDFTPPEERVNIEKFHLALEAAANARNGWSKILQICAPPKRKRPDFGQLCSVGSQI